MKLQVLCDCDENKIITGQMDGEMIWRYKTGSETHEDIQDEAYRDNVINPTLEKIYG